MLQAHSVDQARAHKKRERYAEAVASRPRLARRRLDVASAYPDCAFVGLIRTSSFHVLARRGHPTSVARELRSLGSRLALALVVFHGSAARPRERR